LSEFSPAWAVLIKITGVAHIFGDFYKSYELILAKYGLVYIFSDFFTNSSGMPE
jgi:hypothetical protein